MRDLPLVILIFCYFVLGFENREIPEQVRDDNLNMLILGIETSCDDTAVAVVRDGVEVLSNVRESQPDHEAWGGVVPEIAARLHAENWKGVLEKALNQASVTFEDIDAIAVTQGPGLQTSLLTGTTAGSFLSLLYDKPLIPVQHILGHIMSVHLERGATELGSDEAVKLPALVLTVSGGHTQIHLRGGKRDGEKGASFLDIDLVGTTRDDACGEAFDKLAKMLGLGYPGGPIVSQMAEKGDSKRFDLPYIYLEKDSLDFSFSGLKAACRRIVDEEDEKDERFICDLCASFEATVSRIFLKKLERALDQYSEIQQVHFVGGVSANKRLQGDFAEFLQLRGLTILSPDRIEYCTDNAAMIACAGYFLHQQDPAIAQQQFLEAKARMSI